MKAGSIFIKDDQVYAVHGIQEPLDEVVPSYALPQMVEAILLPFKGQIIYDGLLTGYQIHFGKGIRSNISHIYSVAKHKERIIITLEPDIATSITIKPRKSIAPQLKDLFVTLTKLKSDSPIQNSALALARASIELSLADAQGMLAHDEINAQSRKIFKASKRLLNLLDIMAEE